MDTYNVSIPSAPFHARRTALCCSALPILSALFLLMLSGCPEPTTAPSAAFTYTASYLAVQFMDASSAGSSAISSWSWSFGDGGSSAAQNPSHTYASAGIYTVTLTVVSAVGGDSETKAITVSDDEGGSEGEGEGEGETIVLGIEMVSVPPGSFDMGDAFSEGSSNELPVHTVNLSPYQIGKYEVTNVQVVEVYQWAYDNGLIDSVSSATVTHNGYELLDMDGNSQMIAFSGGTFTAATRNDGYSMANHPVVEISWYGAVAFCNWLSLMEGWTPCYDLETWSRTAPSSGGYRLPTEAEWERAAAWDSASNKHYRFGQSSDSISCASVNYFNLDYCNPLGFTTFPYTSPVGWHDGANSGTTSAVSPVGCYDMSGNAYEWCEDWHAPLYYASSPNDNPCNETPGLYRVLRGGCWAYGVGGCRSAFRFLFTPSGAYGEIGFRLAAAGEQE